MTVRDALRSHKTSTMYKKLISSIAALILPLCVALADEGMWLPMLISQRIDDMHAKGFKLDAEDIYSINQASLKDAVVLFGGGCTGELVSKDGLLFTNHHCGYSQIQKHSSVEHDYLKDGFWALKREDELPNPGLKVRFLERMEDVTAIINSAEDKAAARAELIKKATEGGKGLRAAVEEFYYGNQFFLFIYKEYSDVRLVGAPPSSIGKFGGDTDNWMWPRHTGDFSIFRVYAGKDNEPADYSTENVPYHPKKYFKISRQGVNPGDFTFIYGFPGSTREYITSDAVRYISEISDPAKIDLRTQRLDIQQKYMDQSQAVRIQYSAKNQSVSNAWKKWQGEMKGIRKMKTVATKEAYESAFAAWAKGGQYDGLVEKLDSLYAAQEPYNFAREYTSSQSARACILLRTRFPHHCLRSVSSEPRQTSRFCFGPEASPFLEAARHPPGQQRPPPMTAAPRPVPPRPAPGRAIAQLSCGQVVLLFFFFLKLMLCFSPESATNGNFRISLFSKNYRLLVSSSLSQAINH